MSTQPPCAIARINICAHVKIPNIVSHIPFFGHTNILHTQTGDGSAALAVAVVPYPGRVRRPEFAAMNNEVLKERKMFGHTKVLYTSTALEAAAVPYAGKAT